MRPTQNLQGGGGGAPIGKYNVYLGGWGNLGSQKQKGIYQYGVAPNRQNPFAGAGHAAVFNTWRRFSKQVLYWAPPFLIAYYAVNWAVDRNHYLNSKAGRAEVGQEE